MLMLPNVDVAELWEWPQQLVALNRRAASGERARSGHAVERIRHELGQPVGPAGIVQRQVLRIDLVDVDLPGRGAAPGQVLTGRAHVGKTDTHVVRQLTLHVDRVLVNARRGPIRIDDRQIRADPGEQAERVAGNRRQTAREWVVNRRDRNQGVLLHRRLL
jgi:hypothetical protein